MSEQTIHTFLKSYLPEDSRQDILTMFTSLVAGTCINVENTLIALLERMLQRNPENAEIHEDDFDKIHFLDNDFDRRYKQWCELTENPIPYVSRTSDHGLLLSCCSDSRGMYGLIRGIYSYLEQDYPEPYTKLVKMLEEYKTFTIIQK